MLEPLLLEIEGMKCGSCVRAVEKRLLEQPGVQQASVNLLTRTAWVELDPELVLAGQGEALPRLKQALAGLGYQATLRQAASNLFKPYRLGMPGQTATIRARTVAHDPGGISRLLYLGQIQSTPKGSEDGFQVQINRDRWPNPTAVQS